MPATEILTGYVNQCCPIAPLMNIQVVTYVTAIGDVSTDLLFRAVMHTLARIGSFGQ